MIQQSVVDGLHWKIEMSKRDLLFLEKLWARPPGQGGICCELSFPEIQIVWLPTCTIPSPSTPFNSNYHCCGVWDKSVFICSFLQNNVRGPLSITLNDDAIVEETRSVTTVTLYLFQMTVWMHSQPCGNTV